MEETQPPGRKGPPREARPRKETPRLKLKLLMKSMLVLLPALIQADKLQLKGSYLPLGKSALPALGVTVQQSRGSPRSPVSPAEEWRPPPHTANGGMPKEPPPPPLVRPARDSSSEAGKAKGREGVEPLRHCPLTEGRMQPWPVTGCPEQEKTWRNHN